MTAHAIDRTQETAAKLAGLLYLVTSITAVCAEGLVRGRLLVPGDAGQTSRNVAASERLFRLGIASDIITVVGVIALVWALYVVLKPVDRSLVVLAAWWRLAEASILAVSVVFALAAVLLLGGRDFAQDLTTQQVQSLAGLFVKLQTAGWQIGFVFLGMGSALFSYLWLQSRYIPRALAAAGVFASLLLAVVTVGSFVFPRLPTVLTPAYLAPLALYEVGLGVWLLVRGIRVQAA